MNRCWFKNEEGKKHKTISNDNNMLDSILKQQGLYHNNCHCEEIGMCTPRAEDIQLVITEGKVEYLFTKKFDDVIKQMGYSLDDKNEIIKLYEQLATEAYLKGNYHIREHNKFGVSISLCYSFPGKNEKNGRLYKIKSGWTIFPGMKIKANTIMGGFM